MAVSKTVFLVGTLLAIIIFFVVGYMVGYFTHGTACDEEEDKDTTEKAASRRFFNHAPGQCHLVSGIDHGAEDMQLLPSGLAIITSGLQSPIVPTWRDGIGKMKTFDFNKPSEGATDLTIIPTDYLDLEKFNPHGMSLYHDEGNTGNVYVFVVNHGYPPDMKEAVEKFQLDEGAKTLTHLESIEDDEHFFLINDIVATGPNTFYYTNCLSTRVVSEMMEEIERGEPRASIGYYDGQRGRLVKEKQPLSNGIHMSLDGRYVYVNQVLTLSMSTFQRDMISQDLTLMEDFVLGTDVDNIVIQDDYLWIGASDPDVFKHMLNPDTVTAPSQVLRLKMEDGRVTRVREVFSDDGSLLSGASVALPHGDGLLIGTVCHKALYCQVVFGG